MSSYTTITDGQVDAESPLDEDLMSELRDNTAYNYERALRVGTNTTGVRRAMACGRKAWSITCSGSNGSTTVAITFSSDAEDGNPNFDSGATPVVLFSLEEDDTGAEVDWGTNPADHVQAWIETGTLAYTGCTITIDVKNAAGATDVYNGFLHWMATAAVTSGE